MSALTTLTRPVMLFHKIEVVDDTATSTGITAAALFGLGLPLVVQNVAGTSLGGVVADADVTITMAEGGAADDFTVKLYDIPALAASALTALKSKVGDDRTPGLSVIITLGYLDTVTTVYSIKPVMRGRVTKVDDGVTDDGRSIVTLTGEEVVGYVLRTTDDTVSVAGSADSDTLASQLLDQAIRRAKKLHLPIDGLKIIPGSKLGVPIANVTVGKRSALATLADLADQAKRALVVNGDGVAFGMAVDAGLDPVTLSAQTNVVTFATTTKEGVAKPASNGSDAANGSSSVGAVASSAASVLGQGTASKAAASITVTALGDPDLRVGRSVTIDDGSPHPPASGQSWRIYQVTHRYDSKLGFTTEVVATAEATGAPAQDFKGARGVVDQWNRELLKQRTANPSLDMGEVAVYLPAGPENTSGGPGHRATLHYGPKPPAAQPTAGTESAAGSGGKPDSGSPSVDREITSDSRSDLQKRPVASIFAFDKVGLITPVYPGMRALLAHNGQVVSDAIVAGWVWPTTPPMTPPPNEDGDWWLALPTGLDANERPTGKGVNDLIDARGNRVITTKSARIVVGASALDDVGTRPAVGADDELVIEHSSGTTITLDKDGGLTIEAKSAISVSTKGNDITLGNGSVSLKISGSSVQVGQ
jgi:hypothetical protein